MVEKSWEEAISLFQNNPSHPSVLNTLCEVLLRETKPKIQIDLTEEEFIPFHCESCGSFYYNPTTNLDGKTYCLKCLPPSPHSLTFSPSLILNQINHIVFPKKNKALKIKEEANEMVRARKFEKATALYSQAIEESDDLFVLYLNKSVVELDLKNPEQALTDALNGLERSPFEKFPKGFLREGNALLALNRYSEAASAFCTFYHLSDSKVQPLVLEKIKVILKQPEQISIQECIEGVTSRLNNRKRFQDILLDEINSFELVLSSPQTEDQTELIEKFQCTLCYYAFYQAITTPCGHTFCRICLLRALDHRSVCPICRKDLTTYLSIHDYNTTLLIDSIVQKHFLSDYKEREKIAKEEEEEMKKTLPIFVCTLAFPTIPCPLHIFEPRYRLMMRRCIESNTRTFGMCIYEEDQVTYSKYGTCLYIQDMNLLPDGRSFIKTIGTKRFRITDRSFRDGYNVAKVEYIEDEPLPEEEKERTENLFQELKRLVHAQRNSLRMLPANFQQYLYNLGDEPNEPDSFGWWVLAGLPIPEHEKVRFLTYTRVDYRLEDLIELVTQLQQARPCSIL